MRSLSVWKFWDNGLSHRPFVRNHRLKICWKWTRDTRLLGIHSLQCSSLCCTPNTWSTDPKHDDVVAMGQSKVYRFQCTRFLICNPYLKLHECCIMLFTHEQYRTYSVRLVDCPTRLPCMECLSQCELVKDCRNFRSSPNVPSRSQIHGLAVGEHAISVWRLVSASNWNHITMARTASISLHLAQAVPCKHLEQLAARVQTMLRYESVTSHVFPIAMPVVNDVLFVEPGLCFVETISR